MMTTMMTMLAMLPETALAAVLLTPMSPPPGARGGVWWELDHTNKLVIVNARITFWSSGKTQPDPKQVATIIDALERGWQDQPVLCYRLDVRIHADTASSYDTVPAGSIGLRLFALPYDPKFGYPGDYHRAYPYTRSFIGATADISAQAHGDDPINRGHANTGPVLTYADQSRVWIDDPRPMTLPHEFGHIIGLEHYYDHQFKPIPHSVNDAMMNNGTTGAGKFFPETITKAVRRGGIDMTQLQCSRHLESEPVDIDLHAPLGKFGLDQMKIEADNCTWHPPSTDPKYRDIPNVWSGKLTYSPHMNTPDQMGDFKIHPVFQSTGTVEKPVKFETVSWRADETKQGRSWTWETLQLYDDKEIQATADLQLRLMNTPPAAENLKFNVHYGDSKAGQWGFKNNVPIKVTVRQQSCQ